MFKNLPNILTISRVASLPITLFLYTLDTKFGYISSALLFGIGAITDFLDGYLARSYNIQSKLGKFLDPIADKISVGAIIVLLAYYHKADLFPAIAIICREILVSGLREFLAEIRVSVPVSNLAKMKTFFQMWAMFLLLLGNNLFNWPYIDLIGSIALWIAAILTIVTGYVYLKEGLKYID